MDSNIMDIKGVADYLQIKEQTVYKLVQNKKLPAIKIEVLGKSKRSHMIKCLTKFLMRRLINSQSKKPRNEGFFFQI